MKKAFTMIELIFVIVIIGILASTAIPRLVATRDDALASKAALNLTVAIKNAGMQYTATQNFDNLPTILDCYRVSYTIVTSRMDITRVADFPYCSKANGILDKNNASNQYVFGGAQIVF